MTSILGWMGMLALTLDFFLYQLVLVLLWSSAQSLPMFGRRETGPRGCYRAQDRAVEALASWGNCNKCVSKPTQFVWSPNSQCQTSAPNVHCTEVVHCCCSLNPKRTCSFVGLDRHLNRQRDQPSILALSLFAPSSLRRPSCRQQPRLPQGSWFSDSSVTVCF